MKYLTTHSSKLSRYQKQRNSGNSLAVQWLGLSALTVRGLGSIPGWGTKVLQAARCGPKKKISESLSQPRGA